MIDVRVDDILFTHRHIFPFTFFPPVLTGRLDSLRQLKQIHHSEQRPTRSHNDERVHRGSIGPDCWHRLKAAVLVVKPDPVFTPVLTKSHCFEFLLKQRMVGVGYSETSTFKVAMRRI